jgi:hypothetical protein
VHRHLVEMVKGRLTKRREEYAIAQVPVVEAW